MFKNMFFAAFVLLAATSCSSESEVSVNDAQVENAEVMTPVTVRVSDFVVTMEDLPGGVTRAATNPATYDDVKAVTLAFYHTSGTQQYCVTQLKADASTYETFGQFALELPRGSYKMIVLAYNSVYPVVFNSMTDVVFGEDKSRATFCYVQDVNVTSATPLDLSATLERIVTRLDVVSTDGRPANVATTRVTVEKGGKGFNPITGLATTDAGFVNAVTLSTAIGATTKSSVNFFLATDEETMDVTIETLDEDENVLFSKTVEDVPFKRNRVTILTGAMYAPTAASGTFTLETNWVEEDYNMNF